MEMDSFFWGESANAFFTFTNVDSVRKLTYPLYPKSYYAIIPDSKFKPFMKKNGEIRLLAMDIAAMGGNKNDASSIALIQMIPGYGGKYQRLVSYIETLEGGHGQAQAIRLKQLYDDFDADFVVVDTNGSDALFCGDTEVGVRKKSGTLRWESDWKAASNIVVTGNA